MGVENWKESKGAVLVASAVAAGFPSPASDYLETPLNLNELLIQHPASTFFVRASGESMSGASINDGDLLIVDRSLQAQHKDVIVAVVDGEFTVKRFESDSNGKRLMPSNGAYKPIVLNHDNEVEIWGIVTYVIHKTR